MSAMRLFVLAGGTLACALGIGYVMQRGQPVPRHVAADAPASVIADPIAPALAAAPRRPAQPVALDLERIALTSAQPETVLPPVLPQTPAPLPMELAALDAAVAQQGDPLPAAPQEPALPALGCDVTATAVPAPGAMVDFHVSAPCLGNARVVVHHHGMIFAAVTDQDGELEVAVPALAEHAVFIAAFDNGEGAVATARVGDIGDYDRIALQWSGDAGFQIHAREFGASYGDAGHVWSGAAPHGDDGHASGRVLRLGVADTLSPLMAEVYTFPSGQADRSGEIALSVEAEVTRANCGRDISAQLLQRQGGDQLRTRELDLAVPGCGAVGDFLVLNNLLDDLKIAAK